MDAKTAAAIGEDEQQMQPWLRLKLIRALTHALHSVTEEEYQNRIRIGLMQNQQEFMPEYIRSAQLQTLSEQRQRIEDRHLAISNELRDLIGMTPFDSWCFEVPVRDERFCLVNRDGLITVYPLLSIVDQVEMVGGDRNG